MPEITTVVTCPVHGTELHSLPTKYGLRWSCSVPDCNVIWWGNKDTTPADYETRQARKGAHATFDRLWQGPDAVMSRGEAYEWLQRTFELSPENAHIGLFTKAQCEDLCYAVRRWMGKDRQDKKGQERL